MDRYGIEGVRRHPRPLRCLPDDGGHPPSRTQHSRTDRSDWRCHARRRSRQAATRRPQPTPQGRWRYESALPTRGGRSRDLRVGAGRKGVPVTAIASDQSRRRLVRSGGIAPPDVSADGRSDDHRVVGRQARCFHERRVAVDGLRRSSCAAATSSRPGRNRRRMPPAASCDPPVHAGGDAPTRRHRDTQRRRRRHPFARPVAEPGSPQRSDVEVGRGQSVSTTPPVDAPHQPDDARLRCSSISPPIADMSARTGGATPPVVGCAIGGFGEPGAALRRLGTESE